MLATKVRIEAASVHIKPATFAEAIRAGYCRTNRLRQGFIPVALISTCICVATVPGDGPKARMPRSPISYTERVRQLTPPLENSELTLQQLSPRRREMFRIVPPFAAMGQHRANAAKKVPLAEVDVDHTLAGLCVSNPRHTRFDPRLHC
jgi:hypothetical protein